MGPSLKPTESSTCLKLKDSEVMLRPSMKLSSSSSKNLWVLMTSSETKNMTNSVLLMTTDLVKVSSRVLLNKIPPTKDKWVMKPDTTDPCDLPIFAFNNTFY